MYSFTIPFKKIDKDTPNKKYMIRQCTNLIQSTQIQRTLSFLFYMRKITSRQTKASHTRDLLKKKNLRKKCVK